MMTCSCDRCGKDIRSYDSFPIRGELKIRIGDFNINKDLCPECAKAFDEFMKGCEVKDGLENKKKKRKFTFKKI